MEDFDGKPDSDKINYLMGLALHLFPDLGVHIMIAVSFVDEGKDDHITVCCENDVPIFIERLRLPTKSRELVHREPN